VHGRVGDAVVGAVAPAFTCHQAVLRHLRQMARHVGDAGIHLLGDVANAHLAMPQHVQDAQARCLGQRAKVMRHMLKRFGGKLLHRGQENHLQVGRVFPAV